MGPMGNQSHPVETNLENTRLHSSNPGGPYTISQRKAVQGFERTNSASIT